MNEFRGLILVLFFAVFAAYWLLLAEQLSFPSDYKIVDPVAKQKKAKIKRAKKGKK